MASPRFAFAFKIDGVLRKSEAMIPGAYAILARLERKKIPYILLTNGGGKAETQQVQFLRNLNLEVSEDQLVQAHTPFKALIPSLPQRQKHLGNEGREIARSYGFENVFTTSDIYKAYPNFYPFVEASKAYHDEHGLDILTLDNDGNFQISAILIWSNSRDWGMDLQLCTDLLLSEKGYLGTISPLNGRVTFANHGFGQDGQPTLHWCNPDLIFPSSYPTPRNAQGLFRAALLGMWQARTGIEFIPKESMVGKPTNATFGYGEVALLKQQQKLYGDHAVPLDTVYMVGDDPAADIQGVNAFSSPEGIVWKGILVETGVHIRGEIPAHNPDFIVPDVEEAVSLALTLESLRDLMSDSREEGVSMD